MTTFVAITNAQIDAESYIDTVLAAQWRDNVLAIQEGDASASGQRIQAGALEQTGGSEAVTSATIRASAVDQTAIGSSAVGQGELKTGTGIVSTANTSPSVQTLPGGQYGFYPQTREDGATGVNIHISEASAQQGATYGSFISMSTGGGGTAYAQQRYIQSSPPWESYRNNDAIPIFVFGLLELLSGDIIATYVAEDPPHGNNGPTIINPQGRLLQLAGARMPDMWEAAKDNPAQRMLYDTAVDDLRVYMDDPVNAPTIKAEMARKFTQVEKNADMALIPHPFPNYNPATHAVVVINPTDDRMCGNLHCRHTILGDSIAEMLHEGYLILDNTPMPGLVTPFDVMAVTARLK